MPDLFFLIFGIAVCFIGILIMGGEIYAFFACKEKVNAKILDFKTQKTSIRGSTVRLYSPVVAFELDGKTYKGKSPFSTLRANKYKLNDTIEIFVNKKSPGNIASREKTESCLQVP